MRNSRFIFIFLFLTLVHSAFAQLKTANGYYTLKMPPKFFESDKGDPVYTAFDNETLLTKKLHIDKNGLVPGLSKEETTFIYFMNKDGTVYIHYLKPRARRTAYHSNFGDVTAAAGEIHIQNGQILKINPGSGHFTPTLFEILQFIEVLDGMKADLSKTRIFADFANDVEVSVKECRSLNQNIAEFFKNPRASSAAIQKIFYEYPTLVVRLVQMTVSETEKFSFEKRSEFFSVLNEVWNEYEKATQQGEIGYAFRKTSLYNPLFALIKRGDEKHLMKTFEEVIRLGEGYDSPLITTLINDFFEYAYSDRKYVASFVTYPNEKMAEPVLHRIVEDEKLYAKVKSLSGVNESFLKALKKANRKQKFKNVCSLFFKK